jgi:hypothetical protein
MLSRKLIYAAGGATAVAALIFTPATGGLGHDPYMVTAVAPQGGIIGHDPYGVTVAATLDCVGGGGVGGN